MALQSMTAYGYGESEASGLTYACEIRSLNSRYLEVSVRLPRHLIALEIDLTNHVKSRLRRGKVDVFVDVVKASGQKDMPSLDVAAATHYLGLARDAAALWPKAGLGAAPAPFAVSDLLRMDGVLVSERSRDRGTDAAEVHREALFAALDRSLDAAVTSRGKEGAALEEALKTLLDDLEKGRSEVAQKRDIILPNLQKTYLKRLESALEMLQKAGKTATQIPEERLLSEVAVQSDKADIDEELTRLATHLKEFRRLMADDEAAGRKLDFMCQEMHREVNTMSNKLVQTEVSQYTIEMKQTIERIRQQVQNIE